MKKNNLLLILLFLTSFSCLGQTLPEDIQHRLDSLQDNARTALYNYRIDRDKGELYTRSLEREFLYPKSLWEKTKNYHLSLGMIYDEAMRERIVRLMRNEYEAYELDTLADQYISNSSRSREWNILDICKFDTLQIFKTTLDSLFVDIQNKNPEDSLLRKHDYAYKREYRLEVMKLLQLDTTKLYKQAYFQLVEKDRNQFINRRLNEKNYDRTAIAELCGYIGDKRFIPLLIEALDKPENFRREKVLEALARMRVEPYYSDYVKFRTRTREQILTETPLFDIDDLVYVIGTQESFLELSQYLLSDVAESYDILDLPEGSISHTHLMYDAACSLLKVHIENEEVQEMLRERGADEDPEIIKQLYDWMQKNYGHYKIRRLW